MPASAAVESCWVTLADGIARSNRRMSPTNVQQAARRLVELLVFLRACSQRGSLCWSDLFKKIHANSRPSRKSRDAGTTFCLADWLEQVADRIGTALSDVRPDGGGDNRPRRSLSALSVEGDIMRSALAELAPHDAPGHAAVWPVERLGWIHERLLGRRLVRTQSGSFKVIPDKQAKKTGGIYYTPDYVVQYIVENSLGTLLDRLPAEAAEGDLAVVDPACGCGAFLLAACRMMLQRRPTSDVPGDAARWALGRLHGVDLDPEAVLVARRSLWLEMIDTAGAYGDGRLLAEVEKNIRCGDALTGPVFQGQTGRFDVVFGNPPYRRELNTKKLFERIATSEFGRRWRTPRMDLWYYFIHRGLELLKPGGRLSFIVGSYWTSGSGAEKLIHELRTSAHIEEIFSLAGLRVFPNVGGRHMILTVTKGASPAPTRIKTAAASGLADAGPLVRGAVPVSVYEKTAEQLFRVGRIDFEPPADELLAKIARGVPLGSLGAVRQGIAENPASITARTNRAHGNRWRVGEGVFALTAGELAQLELPEGEMELIRPYHDLCDLGRYFIAKGPSLALIYATDKTCPEIERYPLLRRHLERFREVTEARRETRAGRRPWWQLHWPREERLWQSAKIISVQMAPRPAFALATEPVYVPFSTNVFVPADSTRERLGYITAVLNSRLIWTWYRHHAKRRGVGLEIGGHVLRQTPIRSIDFSLPADKSRHDRLAALADRMAALTAGTRAEPSGDRRATLQLSIARADSEIDQLVCELYGLTDAEIVVIERRAEG